MPGGVDARGHGDGLCDADHADPADLNHRADDVAVLG